MPDDSYAIVVEVKRAESKCLIDMPFEPQFDPLLHAIEAAVNKISADGYPLIPVRMDREGTGGHISERIVELTRSARIVVAVCTPQRDSDPNPNVMFEIGLARALGKPLLILTTASNNLPADIRDIVALTYALTDKESALTTLVEAELRRLLGRLENPLTSPQFSDIWVVKSPNCNLLKPESWQAVGVVLRYSNQVRREMRQVHRDFVLGLEYYASQIKDSAGFEGVGRFGDLWSTYKEHHSTTTSKKLNPPPDLKSALEQIKKLSADAHVAQIEMNVKFVDTWLKRFHTAHKDAAQICDDVASTGYIDDVVRFGMAVTDFISAVNSVSTYSEGLVNHILELISSSSIEQPQPPTLAVSAGGKK